MLRRRFDFSGRHEMKDHSSDNAGRDGNDSAPPPIRENAKGKEHQASQDGDFDKDRSHGSPSSRSLPKHQTA